MLPYGRQSIDDDDVKAVEAQLRSDWLTQGPTVARFEEALCAATGAKYAVAVSSGTAALHLACLAAGVKPGDTGITSTITFVASANCMRYAGGLPSFADVDAETGLVSIESLRGVANRLRDSGTPPKVIVPVDLTGAVADLEAVRAIAAEVGASVIEDAAHSLGATYRDSAGKVHRAGSCAHSRFAILSFHPVKHVTTGEGGAVMTNDEGAYRELLELRSHGLTKDPARLERNDGPWYYEQRQLGFHYRITDLQCALGISQLKKLDRFLARRRELAGRYTAAFQRFEGALMPLRVPSNSTSAYHLYVVRLLARPGEAVGSVAARRRRLFEGLREREIAPQVHYIPVHSQPDFVRAGLSGGVFPGAEAYYSSCISLPLFPAMADADVDRVVSAVGEILAQEGK